jgi:hypothetical protein
MILKLEQQQQQQSIDNEVETGLDFILDHFNQDRLFPRKIMTQKLGYQIEVFSVNETLYYFQQSDFIDCRINAFPSYTEYKGLQRYPPDFIFIDLDKNNFKTERSFKVALSNTLKNIREKLDSNAYPTILDTGGGYHIYQPIECPIVLENIKEFNKFESDKPSEQFLRFAKYYFSNRKADKNNNPSFKSCLLRIPGSINSKYDKKVKIVQKWNEVRSSITRDFIEDFRIYLIQKKIDEARQKQKILSIRNKNRVNNSNYINYYKWIDQILQTPFSDCRKIIVDLILIPYLINIKKLSYQDSHRIIRDWLDKCHKLEKLDRNFDYRISYALKNSMSKEIGPMSQEKIKTDTKYIKLYQLLKEKAVL